MPNSLSTLSYLMLVYKLGARVNIVYYVFIALISVMYPPYHPLTSTLSHACNRYVTRLSSVYCDLPLFSNDRSAIIILL